MAHKERVDVYTIPPNFAKEGTILSGRVEARNAVEAAALVLLLFQLLMAVDLSVKGKIYAGIIVILPVAIFAVIGVQGESLTSFIFQFFCYLARRRTLTVPNGQYRLKRNRRIRKQQKKQYRRERRQAKRKGGGEHRKRSKGTKKEAERRKARREERAKKFEEEAQRRAETVQRTHEGGSAVTPRG